MNPLMVEGNSSDPSLRKKLLEIAFDNLGGSVWQFFYLFCGWPFSQCKST
jgi:hypothetical protein